MALAQLIHWNLFLTRWELNEKECQWPKTPGSIVSSCKCISFESCGTRDARRRRPWNTLTAVPKPRWWMIPRHSHRSIGRAAFHRGKFGSSLRRGFMILAQGQDERRKLAEIISAIMTSSSVLVSLGSTHASGSKCRGRCECGWVRGTEEKVALGWVVCDNLVVGPAVLAP